MNALVERFFIDRKELHEKFRLAFGVNPKQYIQKQRKKNRDAISGLQRDCALSTDNGQLSEQIKKTIAFL